MNASTLEPTCTARELRVAKLMARSRDIQANADQVMDEVGTRQADCFDDVALVFDALALLRDKQGPHASAVPSTDAIRAGAGGELAAAAQKRLDRFGRVYRLRMSLLDAWHAEMVSIGDRLASEGRALALAGIRGTSDHHQRLCEASAACDSARVELADWCRRFDPAARALG